MTISIAARLLPYSHRPGVTALIPLSDLQCQCFPALLRISRINLEGPQLIAELHFSRQGPVSDFTVCLDLENPSLAIWQQTSSGFQKLRLQVDSSQGLMLICERGSCNASLITENSVSVALKQKEQQRILESKSFRTSAPVPFERLSLGSHKAQEIPPLSVKRDLGLLLPVWMRLGALTPASGPCFYSGTAQGLQHIAASHRHESQGLFLQNHLDTLLRTAFFDLLVPRLTDLEYQGDSFKEPVKEENPLTLLTEGSARLRACFLRTEGNEMHILPGLPTLLHAGRLVNGACGNLGTIAISWTKRSLREMVFTPKETGRCKLSLPAEIRRFRLRYGGTNRYLSCLPEDEISFCLGQNLFFDRFEH